MRGEALPRRSSAEKPPGWAVSGPTFPRALSPRLSPGTLSPGTLSPGTPSPGTLSPGTLSPGTLLRSHGGRGGPEVLRFERLLAVRLVERHEDALLSRQLPEKKKREQINCVRAPNQGVESSLCCWIAGPRLAQKALSFHRHRYLMSRGGFPPPDPTASRRGPDKRGPRRSAAIPCSQFSQGDVAKW